MRTNAPESYADRCRAALGAAIVEVTAERVPTLIDAAWTAGRRAEDFAPFALSTVRAERAAAAAPPLSFELDCVRTLSRAEQAQPAPAPRADLPALRQAAEVSR